MEPLNLNEQQLYVSMPRLPPEYGTWSAVQKGTEGITNLELGPCDDVIGEAFAQRYENTEIPALDLT